MPDPNPSLVAPLGPDTATAVPSRAMQPARSPKNIMICCDGTGNEFGDANSNVVKIYTALKIDNDQVGYYHPGVGTMGAPGARHWISSVWSRIRGLAFADGFKDNVLDAYRYLMSVYNDGDVVYIFGFSRGAYTARALAGLLNGYGLLCDGNEGHLPYAWRLYAGQHKNRQLHRIDPRKDSASAFKETFSRKHFLIHFAGLWDTVSSVGWIYSPVKLFSVAQNPTIQTIRHAVSIDERRCFYTDNLYGPPVPPQDRPRDADGNLLPPQDIRQVWFAGAHSDVGGSYPQSESVLSNIALRWMIDQARTAGAEFDECRVNMVLGTAPCAEDPAASALYPAPTRDIVHQSLKGLWKVLEYIPGNYYDKDDRQEELRVPLGAWRKLPPESLLHPSVKQRLDTPSQRYHPANLANADFRHTADPSNAEGYDIFLPKIQQKESSIKRWLLIVLFSALDLVVVFVILVVLALILCLLWHGLCWLGRGLQHACDEAKYSLLRRLQ